MSSADPLLAPVKGAEHREIGGVQLDVVRAGTGRVKRVVYPPGFRWSTHMKAIVGTNLCMHAHVGFLARGQVHIQYADGCTLEFTAPQVVAVEPGHDAWVVSKEPAVLIEFDFEAIRPFGSGCLRFIATAGRFLQRPREGIRRKQLAIAEPMGLWDCFGASADEKGIGRSSGQCSMRLARAGVSFGGGVKSVGESGVWRIENLQSWRSFGECA